MSQARDILRAMRRGEELTQLDATNRFGCTRLAARIYDLKRDGYPVLDRTITLPSGKRVKAYRIDNGQVNYRQLKQAACPRQMTGLQGVLTDAHRP